MSATPSNPATTPRIAVLIPAYNAEQTIGATLASLRANQEPHDVIIVDDGSRAVLKDQVPIEANLIFFTPAA